MDYKKTGRLIHKKRMEQGLSLVQLSKLLLCTPQAISLWEHGERYPDFGAQIMIHKVLGLNPVELITGLEIFDDDLKKGIAGHMSRMDEDVFAAGMMTDEDGFEEYVDLSDFEVMLAKDGEPTGKSVKYTDYFNVEKPNQKPAEDIIPREEYDPEKIYLNQGDCIFAIPVEMLEKIGKPRFFSIRWNEEKLVVIIKAEDRMEQDFFDIPEKVYDGNWKGIHVRGGEFGVMLLKQMGIRKRRQLLSVTPLVNEEKRHIVFYLDEVKRSGAELTHSEFLLPQWQYDELCADDPFVDEYEE